MNIRIVPLFLLVALSALALDCFSQRTEVAKWPDDRKYVVSLEDYPGLPCPNPRGWYHSVANVVDTAEGLVAVYRLSDSHTTLFTHIVVAYSSDGGRTWSSCTGGWFSANAVPSASAQKASEQTQQG